MQMKTRLSALKRLAVYLAMFLALTGLLFLMFYFSGNQDYVELQLSSSESQEVRLYYLPQGVPDFNEQCTAVQSASAMGGKFRFTVPKNVTRVRFDFGAEADKSVQIQSIVLNLEGKKAVLLATDLVALSQSELVELSQGLLEDVNGEAKFTSTGEDPHFVLNREVFSFSQIKVGTIVPITIAVLLALLLTFLIYRYVHLRDIVNLTQNVFANRQLLLKLARNDFRVRYAGSSFGTVWAFAQPVFTILLFWFVFQVGFRSVPVANVPFILWLMAGIIPWFFLSEAWSSATGVFSEYSYLVKKIVFQIDILPLVKLISAWFVHIFFMLFMLFVFALYGYFPAFRMLGAVYFMFCLIYLALGLGFITASVVVFFRDISPMMNIILQFGMWLTPIMWDTNILPSGIVWIFKLNPMYYIVQGYRNCMLGDAMPAPTMPETIYFWLATTGIFMVGMSLFHRLKPHFADML